MKTTLDPETLARLHTEGQAMVGQFVDPVLMSRVTTILQQRGEDWAQSVLLRTFDRRSLLQPQFPWLNNGEPETLVLADKAEWESLTERASK